MAMIPFRIPAPVLLLVLILAFLAVSPVTGALSRRHAPPPPAGDNLAPQDAASMARLWRGYHREGDGLLEDAEADYGEALSSAALEVDVNARAGLDRIRHIRERLGFAFPVVNGLAAASLSARAPLVGIAALLVLAWLLRSVRPRRGTRVRTFGVYGGADPTAPSAFQSALLAYSNEIKRVYGSDYARRAGIQLFFNDFTGSTAAEASTMEQALAETRDVDAKAALTFAFRQSLQYLRDLSERPRFAIGGVVRLLPGAAMAVASIRDLETGEDATLEATAAELADMPMRDLVERALLRTAPMGFVPVSSAAGDLRSATQQLQALALVLASKIRWRESQAITLGERPSRWETVCVFIASARHLA